MTTNKFAIGIVGAGKVGAILGAAYKNCGHEITAIYTASETNIERNEILLPNVPILSIEEVVRKSEIVFFTIPDDELAPTITGLAKLGVFKQGQILIHTSGRHTLEVFENMPNIIGMSIHPIMTFTGTSLDLPKLKNTYYAVNASKLMLPIAQALVMELEGSPITVSDENRSLYHAGLSHGANHLSLIVNQSMEMLEKAGVENPESIVKPLFEAALERSLMQKYKSISGPVPRGDTQTIQKHLETISQILPEIEELYKLLTEQTTNKCLENKIISQATADRIHKILEQK